MLFTISQLNMYSIQTSNGISGFSGGKMRWRATMLTSFIAAQVCGRFLVFVDFHGPMARPDGIRLSMPSPCVVFELACNYMAVASVFQTCDRCILVFLATSNRDGFIMSRTPSFTRCRSRALQYSLRALYILQGDVRAVDTPAPCTCRSRRWTTKLRDARR